MIFAATILEKWRLKSHIYDVGCSRNISASDIYLFVIRVTIVSDFRLDYNF